MIYGDMKCKLWSRAYVEGHERQKPEHVNPATSKL